MLGFAAVGLVVGIRVISQQGLFFLGGALTDLFGPRRLVFTGCLLRTLGLGTIAWAPDTTAFVFGVIVVGAAGALFSPAVDALVARVDADRRRTSALGRGPASARGILALNAQLFSLVPLVFAERQISAGRTGLTSGTLRCIAVSAGLLWLPGRGCGRRPDSRSFPPPAACSLSP